MYIEEFKTNGHTFILKADKEPTKDQIWGWWESIWEFFCGK